MKAETALATETEQERQQTIANLVAEDGPNWATPYQPGSFGCHELLDRAALAARLVDDIVLSHPACIQNPDWYALAQQAISNLEELYQQVGQVHLEDKCTADNHSGA